MAFFIKLKVVKNALTGGAAKVSINLENPSFDGLFAVVVSAEVGAESVD